jgi:peptidylprolyl isomerase
MITNGSTVQVHYTGKLQDGEVFDSSEGREPLQFQVGTGNIINGFEKAIIGKTTGDKVNVTIPVDEAYGPVREDLFVQIPFDKLPGQVEVGQILQADSGNGQPVQVMVKEVNEDHIIIDGNHPLAGMNLTFDIEIVDVQ